jgi:prepilin-type N-terminal cleavage/methylation domain-containing protein
MKNLRRVGGFTLVELIFALFVAGLLMSAVYFTMISGQKSSSGVERKVAAQQDVRAALEIMALEIGMASYNPFYLLPSQIWVDPATCNGTGGATPQYRGIQVATPTAITVEMDVVENGTIGDANEVISYVYDGAAGNQFITRSVNCGTSDPFLGAGAGAATGTKTVNVINSNGTVGTKNGKGAAAVFRYYNSSGGELYPYAGQVPGPADIPNIRRIDIALAVETEEVDPSTHNKRQMIYSTSVLVRNHAIN